MFYDQKSFMSLSKLAASGRGNKWKSHYNSSRKFKPEWQHKFNWVRKAIDGSQDAHCSLCKANITPRLSNLNQHEQSAKHKRQSNLIFRNTKIPRVNEDERLKEMELQMAVTITCHSSINAVDHLGEIVVQHRKGSKLENMKLHRTKCSRLIQDVISPALNEDLASDMAGQKYCIVLDESTDVSCGKHLCLVVRYYSVLEKRIVTSFLSLIPVVKATGKDLFEALESCLAQSGLSLMNCIGYATDGASVMVGEHDSVWSRIRAASPNCVLMKCICHSLALCIKHAFEKMPANLGFMLKEIPKWFSNSGVRRDAYKLLFETFEGCSVESSTIPLPFQRCNLTRWLVRGKIIFNILSNWDILKTYFSLAECEGEASVRFKAQLIKEMLHDPINYLYFHFLSPVVSEFERVNGYFQAIDAEANEVVKELDLFYNSLRGRVYNSSGVLLPTDRVDYGAKFVFEADALIHRTSDDETTLRRVHEAYGRCHSLLLEAAEQVKKCLPTSKDIFKGLSYLHPSRVLSQVMRVPLNSLPMQHLIREKFEEIDNQY